MNVEKGLMLEGWNLEEIGQIQNNSMNFNRVKN